MGMRIYVVGMALATLLAWASLAAILIYLEPSNSNLPVLALFYLSLFIGFSGALFLIGFFIRRVSHRRGITIRQANVSFRQGILLAVILVGAMFLQSQKILAWWNVLSLLAIAGLAEWWAMRRN
ncbi:MAG: hypothetical protein A3A94_02155 [Candidatus Portnoybacteria bacterium RIFCSPLOWO2_01_FULL_43_11]|uniref:Uncharacterized protein n=4 Tax=Candidatus Portnoyibacteriota TaxID=1817913 RepID=A0A1G2FC60_9BACT|nr:MAG: hypothetical protein A2815_01960 [Candidatus Portnoybacteria bacterium RIFCSPHIGHO2_01_FULL_40_12b]OGZ37172.1 MAG: hypothetical protein A3D38_01375 [Candidatus Portnoybacteria bacterium RIFCSPHIGHO2_02_FULL_40_23]OGZ37681.1 MAG: hypothetical protein A3E90_00110 [Candidatus Portnoybacteria bacterium RIFCSPHIGHO2_12_FULL_40_11]OGZ38818.1 MAG: hypothetical protein A3A94_02155 [Candidatus Portnoybacteria bacterium RIFCSPLOWO2_01_FULL_43_11]OGZ40406.1 MAG: hypothetical protein A3I20_01860 [C